MIKKLFSVAIAAMIAVGFVSCSKDNEPIVDKDVKIKFNVAEMPSIGEGTRSVKTGWVAGDEILVLLKVAGQTGDAIMKSQTITLKKTASGWTATKNFESSWGTSGVFYAIYHRGNVVVDNEGGLPNYEGGEIFTCGQENYTVTDGEIDLGTINMNILSQWTNGLCQISIAGLDSSKDWRLSVVEPGRTPTSTNARKVFYSAAEHYTFENGVLIYNTYVSPGSTGLYTGTDHIFWFPLSSAAYTTLCFYLTDGTDVYTFDSADKELEAGKAYVFPAITESTKWIKK